MSNTSLKEFVKESLNQITEAVQEFNKENIDNMASTGPVVSSGIQSEQWSQNGMLFTGFGENDDVQYATLVDFDVAVTAEENEGAKVGTGIKVVSLFSVDGSMEANNKNGSISRVKMRIPLQVNLTKTQG